MNISIIRLGTYCIFVLFFLLSRQRSRVLPVALADGELRDAAVEEELQLKQWVAETSRMVNSAGFLETKRSGSELLTIARKAAENYGRDLRQFHRPEITVRTSGSLVQWVLLFTRDYGPSMAVAPAETFSVVIDDATGAATVKDETALM